MSESGFIYNYPLKGKVTSLDDPANLNRIQVYIPNFHGNYDETRVGSESSDPYPWAQVNTIITPNVEDSSGADSSENSLLSRIFSGAVSSLSRLFKNDEGKGFSQISPEVGDVVWLIFEGGDIRSPVYFGTAALPANSKDSVIVDTASIGSGGISNYSADGSYGNTYQLAGGSLVDILSSIVFFRNVARNYSYVFCGSRTSSMAVGVLKWEANNGSVDTLIRAIYNKNSDNYNAICKQHCGKIIPITKSWKNQTLTNGSGLYGMIRHLITCAQGKEVQDSMVTSKANELISKASSLSISDPTAVILFADMCYYGGETNATSAVKASSSKSLEGIYSAASSMSSYDELTPYNLIQLAISQGKFVKTTTVDLTTSNSELLRWPVPASKVVTTPYSSTHTGIDIKASANSNVIASHAGTVINSGFNNTFGNFVSLKDSQDKIRTYYKNLGSIKSGITKGATVKVSQSLGTVGLTGDAKTYQLHYEVYTNGSYVNPESLSYGSGNNSSSAAVFNKQQIWNYLRSTLGYSAVASAAIMGCFETESNNVSCRVEGDFSSGYSYSLSYTQKVDSGSISISSFSNSGGGYGLAQWTTNQRKSGLYNYAKNQGVSISNTAMQLRYMKSELTDPYYATVVSALNSGDLYNACHYFHYIYENPATKIVSTVYGHAQSFLNQFS